MDFGIYGEILEPIVFWFWGMTPYPKMELLDRMV